MTWSSETDQSDDHGTFTNLRIRTDRRPGTVISVKRMSTTVTVKLVQIALTWWSSKVRAWSREWHCDRDRNWPWTWPHGQVMVTSGCSISNSSHFPYLKAHTYASWHISKLILMLHDISQSSYLCFMTYLKAHTYASWHISSSYLCFMTYLKAHTLSSTPRFDINLLMPLSYLICPYHTLIGSYINLYSSLSSYLKLTTKQQAYL